MLLHMKRETVGVRRSSRRATVSHPCRGLFSVRSPPPGDRNRLAVGAGDGVFPSLPASPVTHLDTTLQRPSERGGARMGERPCVRGAWAAGDPWVRVAARSSRRQRGAPGADKRCLEPVRSVLSASYECPINVL